MTPMQPRCLDAIRRLTVDGVSPSYSELQTALGLRSRGGVWRIIHALRDRGLIRFSDHVARSIEIIEDHYSRERLALLSSERLAQLHDDVFSILSERLGGGDGKGPPA